ncbi:hypothetical protein GL264_16530 [Aeromonas jandaei]|uniref:beta family protein n=1 Tax=Aeromonas jandaei TaxID=650 RepID=UPI001C5BC996|nr:beta family protein [Aeromonas jandaei]MBW3762395.1 hypothetical protein [Aeromonas jandaei]
MIPKYVPIMKAKKGELTAYRNLSAETKAHTVPLFEVAQVPKDNKRYSESAHPVQLYISDVADQIAEVVGKTSILVDISRWAPNATTENGEHILGAIIDELESKGVDVIPVIGYERWEDPEYATLLSSISEIKKSFCIRLESYAFEDMIEENHFYDVLNDIIDSLDLDCSKCIVMLDFSDVTAQPITEIQEVSSRAISTLSKYDFLYVVLAGCSIYSVINDMVPKESSTGYVVRREWMAWKILKELPHHSHLVFGDYCITSPQQADGIIAPDANGKIRYTIKDKYYVIRGYSKRKLLKGAQMYALCKDLISSPHYRGTNFSWGDMKINSCANEEFKGNPTDWIAIDTSHHITHVVLEVAEFEQNAAAKAAQGFNFSALIKGT